jgi:4-diphosphocytidyl-2-C-methyl-D-erythritol kinase
VQPVLELARPKVNLTLAVLGRRADGYHALDSLVAFALDVADAVTLVPGVDRCVTTTGPFAGSIAGENLVAVTLDRIAEAAPGLTLGSVTLEKNLPAAAGIGGGSADAAAVIRAVQRANGGAAAGVDWHVIARRLGADVPVCLISRAQRMQGVGDILTPLPGLPELAAVLVNPQAPVPADKTAQVFRRLGAGPLDDAAAGTEMPGDLSDPARLLAHMRAVGNDLLAPALAVVPQIGAVLAALRGCAGCELAQLSGGGPTCLGVFPDMAAASRAERTIAAAEPAWWVRATRLA